MSDPTLSHQDKRDAVADEIKRAKDQVLWALKRWPGQEPELLVTAIFEAPAVRDILSRAALRSTPQADVSVSGEVDVEEVARAIYEDASERFGLTQSWDADDIEQSAREEFRAYARAAIAARLNSQPSGREAGLEACDLIAERKHDSTTRSPEHNARLLLGMADGAEVHRALNPVPKPGEEGERPQPPVEQAGLAAAMMDVAGWLENEGRQKHARHIRGGIAALQAKDAEIERGKDRFRSTLRRVEDLEGALDVAENRCEEMQETLRGLLKNVDPTSVDKARALLAPGEGTSR